MIWQGQCWVVGLPKLPKSFLTLPLRINGSFPDVQADQCLPLLPELSLLGTTCTCLTDSDVNTSKPFLPQEEDRFKQFILQSSGLNHFQRSSINFNETIPSLAVGNSRCSFLSSEDLVSGSCMGWLNDWLQMLLAPTFSCLEPFPLESSFLQSMIISYFYCAIHTINLPSFPSYCCHLLL